MSLNRSFALSALIAVLTVGISASCIRKTGAERVTANLRGWGFIYDYREPSGIDVSLDMSEDEWEAVFDDLRRANESVEQGRGMAEMLLTQSSGEHTGSFGFTLTGDLAGGGVPPEKTRRILSDVFRRKVAGWSGDSVPKTIAACDFERDPTTAAFLRDPAAIRRAMTELKTLPASLFAYSPEAHTMRIQLLFPGNKQAGFTLA